MDTGGVWCSQKGHSRLHRPLQDTHEDHDTSTENAYESNHDPQFEPIVSLPEQEIKTLEEDEEELFKM